MKLLPCTYCRQPALGNRSGLLLSAGQCPDSSLRYSCRRCGRVTVLAAAEFARLPDMTETEIASASCDLVPGT